MPKAKKKGKGPGISSEELQELLRAGADSDVLRARMAFIDADSFRKYLAPVAVVDRVHPSMLPTQASGRWSTTEPPLVNFPTEARAKKKGPDFPPLREVFIPDETEYWIGFDLDAIEARLAAAYAGIIRDLEMFNAGLDVHTMTSCEMFGLPQPPTLVSKAVHSGPECAEWRERSRWMGKEDIRRVMAKTARYSLTYGTDERSILEARDVKETGATEEQLLDAARRFLRSRPELVAWKRRTWAEVYRTGMSRTAHGRRRKLVFDRAEVARYEKTGKPGLSAREGLNHKIQGWVADAMNQYLAELAHPAAGFAVLKMNAHDGAKLALPLTVPVDEAVARCKAVVERTWDVEGSALKTVADWEVIYPDGRKEKR